MSMLEPGLAVVVSRLVLTVKPLPAYVPAAAFVIPAIVSVPAVLAGSEQVPPLSASVIVTVWPLVDALAEHVAKPVGSVIVGEAGIVKPAGKTTVIASPALSAPVELDVKPTVQVADAPAERVDAEKLTLDGAVAAAIVTADAGFAADVSVAVLTLNVFAASEPAAGLVSADRVRVAVVLAANAHEAPTSVIVAVCPLAVADAVQLLKPPVSATVGVAGTVKPELKTTVIVSPARSAPVALDLKLTVHVERAPPVCGEPLNVTALTDVAAAIVTLDAGFAATVSPLVETLNVFAASVPAAGFVSPCAVSVAAVLFASAHDAPASVTVTVVPEPEPVAVQLAKPLPSTIVGVAGTVKPALNAIVIVLPAASAPLELVVKPTVQSERAPPVCGDPENETAVTGLAITIADAGFAAPVSRLVAMLNVLAAYEPLAGLVIPLTVRLTAAEPATAHEAPASVTVTMLLDVEPVAVQLVKPELRTIVGVAGIVKLELNFSEIVSPAAIAPLALVVNVSVQFALEPPV
jgi:hypothetical protein